VLKRKTPLKPGGPIKRKKKRKMSELTPREQEKRREKWVFDRKLKEVDALSRELAYLMWGGYCHWPLCKTQEKAIQWHHFITRDVWAVRWDPRNLIPLHAGCHLYGIHGKHSHLGMDIMIKRLTPDGFDKFMQDKNDNSIKRNLETLLRVEAHLKSEITRVGNSL